MFNSYVKLPEGNQSQRKKNEDGDHLKPIADVLYYALLLCGASRHSI